MKDDYNRTETPYSREMEGQNQAAKECPHGLLIADEDCPDCQDDGEQPKVDEDDERGGRR